MEYKRYNNRIIARLDKEEEILEQIKNIALKENIKLANINALGATSEITVGVFNTNEKKYYANSFKKDMEIVSLTGSINMMNNEFYSHLHIACGDSKGIVIGGHLNKAIVSATVEMFIEVIDGEVDRQYDDEIGLNLFKF